MAVRDIVIKWRIKDHMNGPLHRMLERYIRIQYKPYRHMWE